MSAKKDPDMFWTRAQERMVELDIPSIRELEKMAGVSNGTISVRKNQLKMPTVTIAEGLCRALRWTWVELWTQAGYIPPGVLDTHVSPQELEFLDILNSLSPARQAALLDAARGMAGREQQSFPALIKGAIALDPELLAQGDPRPMTNDQWAAIKRYFDYIWEVTPPQLKSWVGNIITAATARVIGEKEEEILSTCGEEGAEQR